MYINVHYKQKACGFVPYFYWTFISNICITHFTLCTGSYHNSRRYVLTNLVSFDVLLGCLITHPHAFPLLYDRLDSNHSKLVYRIRRGFEELAGKKKSGMLLHYYYLENSFTWHFSYFFVQLAGSKGETKNDQTTRTKWVHHQYKYIASIFVFSSIVSSK